MTSLPTARGELPRLYELDPLRFQGLCRDLCQLESDCATADVFGTPGQLQRGVDVLAIHRGGDETTVGQCKRIRPDALRPTLLKQASKEFLRHRVYWQERGIRRFILFVAPDISRTQIQEEVLQQRAAFKALGIEYEVWGEATIVSKLRTQPGITTTYLGRAWRDTLCGTAISGFPRLNRTGFLGDLIAWELPHGTTPRHLGPRNGVATATCGRVARASGD